jgi:signal transduction histidine kinase
MFEGANRAIFGLEPLGDGRLLVASDWNLHVLQLGTRQLVTLLEGFHRFRALTRLGDDWIAATVGGQIHRLRMDGDLIDVELVGDPPSGDEAVMEWCWSGGSLWFRTRDRVGIWEGPFAGRSFEFGNESTTSALAAHAEIGIWLGTDDGLWRATGEALFPARVPGLPRQSIRRIIDARAVEWDDPRIDRDVYVLLEDGRLYAFDIPTRFGTTLASAFVDSVRVGLRPDGASVGMSAALVRINEAPIWDLVARAEGPVAQLAVGLPASLRGPQTLDWLAVDLYGRPSGTPVSIRRVVRARATWLTALLIVLVGVIGALWAFRRRRRHLWIRAIGYGGGAALALLVPHFLLYYQVPWGTALAIVGAYGIAGVVLDRRDRALRIKPRVAGERLKESLRAFLHRGGGIGPVGELRLMLTNAPAMSEANPNFEDEVRDVLDRVLDATAGLATNGARLAQVAQLEPALSRRVFRRLEDLREGAGHALHDPRQLRDLLYRHELRVSMVEAATSFLQGAELLGGLLQRLERVRIREFLERIARQVRRESAEQVAVELRVADATPQELPIPESSLAEVYDNLVRNAMRALEGRPSQRILLSAKQDGAKLVLGFEDSGPGVPPAERDRIFEKGVSLSGSTGFGLSRCRELVRSWGGTIRCVEGRELGGARFEIHG